MIGPQTADPGALRAEIDRALADGDPAQAADLLARLWSMKPGPATASFVISRFERLGSAPMRSTHRVAILRSFSVEPVVPVLRATALVQGLDLDVRVGDFNAYPQEILDPNSWLSSFDPEIVLVAVQTRDLAPELWNGFADLSPEEVTDAVARSVAVVEGIIRAFRARSHAHLILHGLEVPSTPSSGILDAHADVSQAEAIRAINRELGRVAREQAGVHLLDYDGLVARHGRLAWHDERKWLTVRLPIAADCLVHLANEWMRFIRPLTGNICKVLVTDLDNTLWGGVVGEDGMTGIRLDAEYPGAAYQALQRALLDLYQRGILLAVCSKNNPAEALEAIERHPGMLLRSEQFAAMRIGWADKATALREIAADLSLGIDALAFLDDNPAERAWVRSQLPEVTVVDLPDDPMGYAAAVRDCAAFERLSLSNEDRERGRYYAEQRQRTELQSAATSLEEFYWSLQTELEVEPVGPTTVARVAQLTQKTNQFNVTTRRYSEQEIADLAGDPARRVYTARVRDRFGDNGLVGVAIVHRGRPVWEIDTLLLSCRVIGRTVETALLAILADEARSSGATCLAGWFVPTRKNSPARDLYRSHGFACVAQRDEASRWELDLTAGTIAAPPWINRRAHVGGVVQ